MFVHKFVSPYVVNFYQIKANHGIALFIMSKKAYVDLKKLKNSMIERKNIFKFPKYFEEFTMSQAYKNMLDQVTLDAEMVEMQSICYSQDIEMCSKDIQVEFDLNKVYSKNFDNLVNETVEQYWFLLAESLGSVKGKNK